MTSAVANEHEQIASGELGSESHGSHSGHHSPHLAHHFDDMEQQFAAGKLGIWLFLITEILFFSGLFVAYAVYRSLHPEIFVYAHQYLDKSLGALNTVVLIFSSLTMAWAVRAAQLGQRRALVGLLATTLACASFFLGVKAVEYSHKWDDGILWAREFRTTAHQHHEAGEHHGESDHPGGHDHHGDHGHHDSASLRTLSIPAALALFGTLGLTAWGFGTGRRVWGVVGVCLVLSSLSYFVGVGVGQALPPLVSQWVSGGADPHGEGHEAASIESPGVTGEMLEHPLAAGLGTGIAEPVELPVEPAGVGIFFSIYYVMTGLHAIHILAGMGVIAWLLINSAGGMYGPNYFGPVDYVGLYWHLVDLVWIYLFPLLYLIH